MEEDNKGYVGRRKTNEQYYEEEGNL